MWLWCWQKQIWLLQKQSAITFCGIQQEERQKREEAKHGQGQEDALHHRLLHSRARLNQQHQSCISTAWPKRREQEQEQERMQEWKRPATGG
jgi:hypothetical protein